jgi:hypothetical protein
MRSLLALLTVSLALLAGCGGGDDGASSPLDAALSFLPADAPFAAAIDTDVEGDQYRAAGELLDSFPGGDQIVERLREQLEQSSGRLSFEDDIEPLLGNPFVVGATDVRSFTAEGESDDFVAAIQAEDGDKLRQVIEDSDVRESGERNGATIYEDDGSRFAVEDDVLVVAGTDRALDAALERADGDDHLDEDSFDESLAGLPEDALVKSFFDVEQLVRTDPDTRDARQVKWVSALRTLGLTGSATSGELRFEFNLSSDGDELSDEDLPLAAGDASPAVVERAGEVSIGIRDPGQVVRFAEAAARAIDPRGFGQYDQAKQQIAARMRVDVDRDVIAQFDGDMSATVAVNGEFGVRAELKDPAAFERTLERVADALPAFARGAGMADVQLAKPRGGSPFYALANGEGDSVVFGVVDDVFVLANEPRRAGTLARQRTSKVEGAEGSMAVTADAEQVATRILGQIQGLGLGQQLGSRLFTAPLGQLSGSVRTETDGMRGRFTLAID